MDPSMAPIPQRLPDEGAPLAEYPSLGSRLWVDRLRLLGMMVFFAQLTETEATHHIPCPLNACHCSSLSSFFSGLVCRPCENSPPHIHAGWSLEVGTTPTERLPSADVAVVRGAHVVPPRLVTVHRASATRTHAMRGDPCTGVCTPNCSIVRAGTTFPFRFRPSLLADRLSLTGAAVSEEAVSWCLEEAITWRLNDAAAGQGAAAPRPGVLLWSWLSGLRA